jgi:hypothetical protein
MIMVIMMVEGRRSGLDRANRICPCCDLVVIESEIHFLLVCPLYADLRQRFSLNTARNSETTFVQMMSTNDVNLLRNLGKFLLAAGERRSDFLDGV